SPHILHFIKWCNTHSDACNLVVYYFSFPLQMSDASDDEYMSLDETPEYKPKRDGPFSSLEYGYLVRKFDRPLPSKEDLVVYVDGGRTKTGYVNKVGYKDERMAAASDCRPGIYFHVDEIPSMRHSYVAGNEAITLERCYSVGETVMAFKNKHEDTEQAMSRSSANTIIGQITAVKTTADVMVLPDKTLILKDVPIQNNYKMLEMMNYNASHNYVLYDEWIGDISGMENEITCFYYKQRVTLIEDSKMESFFRRKGEHRRSNKAFIPGETVYVELRHLVNKNAKWESGEVPQALRRKYNKSHSVYSTDIKIRLVIEKVSSLAVTVKWVQSPSSLNMPPARITKDDLKKLKFIDVSANPRISSADRMVFTFNDEVQQMTKKEYNQWLTNEYKKWFVNPRTLPKTKAQAESSQLHPVMEEEEGMKSEKDEEEEDDVDMDEQAAGDDEDAEEAVDEKPVASTVRISSRLKRGRKAGARAREPRKKKAAATLSTSKPERKKSREGKWVKGNFCVEVLISRTVCDVEWMDGTITKNILGACLVPVDPDLDQQDHLPGNTVAKKSDDKSGDDDSFGIILRVNVEERVATVRWFKLLDKSKVTGGAQHTTDEEVTLFDIIPHPHYKRQFVGYIGVCVSKADSMASPHLSKTCCKIMANLQNGKQLVEYMDGTTDEVWPMEIMAIPLHEHEDDSDGEDDWLVGDESGLDLANESMSSSTAATAGTAVSGGASTSTRDVSTCTSGDKNEEKETSAPSVRVTRASTRSSKKRKKSEVEDIAQLIPKSLPAFEKGTLTLLDGEVNIGHKYLNEPVMNPGTKWTRAVLREHAHLREHLPKEIHLWAWESRLDLLTCVIFGPSGTPFELTPFHFDVHIPDTFPAVPPKVHYYAWSQDQLNPNLYQAGKVCVSLLGTWDGDGAEKWTPTSNLLQVFISIQGLILNSEPYFNEAGYEERKNVPEHEANSKRYNETATINSLEYLWRIYDRPPAHIASVVRQGVDSRIVEFKKRVMAWSEGKKQPEYPVHSSKGFRLALKSTMNKVVSILNKHADTE
ncbi:hypothetical protein PMAYCL1PPCAC_12775, partial [Pristionchus mayeri]